jgi:hypothetical protein
LQWEIGWLILARMGKPAQVEWEKVKLEYCKNSTVTAQQLADQFGVSVYSVRHKIERERWAAARESYSAQYAERLRSLSIRNDAPQMLQAINDKQLKQCEELRVILNMKLKMQDASGKIVPRPDVNIIEVRCAVAAFAEIYRMERLALGASTDNVAVASTSANAYDNMTEEELLAELKEAQQRLGLAAA